MGIPNRSGQFESDAMTPDRLNQNLRKRLPAELQHTFTEAQLTAIRNLYNMRSRTSSPLVDQRFTLPCPGGHLYGVLMIGRDRRSKLRARTRKNLKQAIRARLIMTLGVTLACSGMMGLVKLGQVYSAHTYRKNFETEKAGYHPASVPFKEDQMACEASGREWRNEECIDHEHNPSF